MSKLLTILSLLAFTSFSVVAQDQVGDIIALADVPESKALVQQAEQYTAAVVNSEFESIAKLTHEDIITMGGGEEFLIMDLKAELESLAAQGLTYSSSEVGAHPEFLESEGELQTILPVKFHLIMNSKKVESWVNLFAASTDEGVTWKFVNLEKFDEPSLREFVKNVSSELVYPTR